MKAPSVDVKDMLEYETDLGLVFKGNLFINREPATPQNTVTVFDTPGMPPQMTFNRQERYEYPSVQIRVRDIDFEKGWKLIEDIKELLHGRAHETWNDSYYSLVRCSSGPAFLDWDNSGRVRLIININLQRR